MKHQKLLNLLNETKDCKFGTRKWTIFNDNYKGNYDVRNEIIKLSIMQKFQNEITTVLTF